MCDFGIRFDHWTWVTQYLFVVISKEKATSTSRLVGMQKQLKHTAWYVPVNIYCPVLFVDDTLQTQVHVSFIQALSADPSDFSVLSNRCAARLKLNLNGLALTDAISCTMIAPTWAKGYYRLGW
jgi:hypothetical protein